jgi:hypothetical protein
MEGDVFVSLELKGGSEDREVVRGGFSGLDTWRYPLELQLGAGGRVGGLL